MQWLRRGEGEKSLPHLAVRYPMRGELITIKRRVGGGEKGKKNLVERFLGLL